MTSPLLQLEQTADLRGCVLAYGHFTTIHPGHIRYLRHARSLGQELVVALVGDGPADQPSPYPFRQPERAEALSLLGLADAVLLLHSDELEQAIESLQPAILVLGTELEGAQRSQQFLELLRGHGGSLQFHAGEVTYASTDLLDSSERDLLQRQREQFKASCRRQNLDRAELLASMQTWPETRLIVLALTQELIYGQSVAEKADLFHGLT